MTVANFLRLRAAIQRFLRDESGTDTVEFALSATLVLAVVFGVMDCSRAVYIDHYVAQAAHDGAHYAMVRGATWSSSCAGYAGSSCTASSSNVSDYVASTASTGVTPSQLYVTTTWPGTDANGNSCSSTSVPNAQGCIVTVQVRYGFAFVLPFLPSNLLHLSSTAAATILQ